MTFFLDGAEEVDGLGSAFLGCFGDVIEAHVRALMFCG